MNINDNLRFKSKCCSGTMKVSTADEGTSCYICQVCNKPTDPETPNECKHGCAPDNCGNCELELTDPIEETMKEFEKLCAHPEYIEVVTATKTDIKSFLRQALLSCEKATKEKFKETLKLWRPYFYRDKINEEDIDELNKLL